MTRITARAGTQVRTPRETRPTKRHAPNLDSPDNSSCTENDTNHSTTAAACKHKHADTTEQISEDKEQKVSLSKVINRWKHRGEKRTYHPPHHSEHRT